MTEDNEQDVPPVSARTFNLLDALTELDAKTLTIEQTVGEGLILRSAAFGEKRDVSVKPCFPITQPGRMLFFRDSEGQPIGILCELDGLSPPSREALLAELDQQHFVPKITRIDAIFEEFAIPIWEVQTDRGPRRLQMRSSRDVHRLSEGRIYVRDAEGNGYVIPDIRELDAASRNLVEFHV